MYTLDEIDAIRFYEGDTRVRGSNGYLMTTMHTGKFRGDQKAYRTLNALLFPGINNEKERIKEDGHNLNQAMVENLETTISIYCNVYAIMLKSASKNKSIITKRVERFESVKNLMEGETVSFTSTSKSSYDGDFANKNGIVLLEFHIPDKFPYIDLEKILKKEYKYKSEKEILLPPFTVISIDEGILLNSEKHLRDINKKPPRAKYIIEVLDDGLTSIHSDTDMESLKQFVLNKDNCKMASDMICHMNEGEWEINFNEYINWKACLQLYLKLLFNKMRTQIL
nr:ADP-ribosyltransferase [uncultured Anaerocolumna sp.]